MEEDQNTEKHQLYASANNFFNQFTIEMHLIITYHNRYHIILMKSVC